MVRCNYDPKDVSRQVKPTRIKSDFSTNNISKSVSLEFKLFALLYNYGFIFQVYLNCTKRESKGIVFDFQTYRTSLTDSGYTMVYLESRNSTVLN